MVSWVPSHGKHPEWKPRLGFESDVRLWRVLNHKADKAAEEHSKLQYAVRVMRADDSLTDDTKWAHALLVKLHRASAGYCEKFLRPDLSDDSAPVA